MTFKEIFGKPAFIEHLTEKQQEELFSILKEKCLVKKEAKKYINKHIPQLGLREDILQGLG